MKREAASSVLKNMACLMGVCGRWQACLGRTHATLFIFKASILPRRATLPSRAFRDLQSVAMKRIYHSYLTSFFGGPWQSDS